ncbi:MAG: Hsp70 family protein, partial [Deltaproteobacteria bacterium]|nr:Hsp70 family protein [Deltaproteobacteria bacterium]
AFYAWIDQAGAAWRDFVEPGDVVLVVDVGGGTADFTLVAISETDGDLQLDRLSVGEHILLGGDNMDLALAYTVRGELEAVGKKMDNWQFLSLTHAVRTAKEKLWSDESLTEVPLAVPGRGAGLLASTISTKLTREVLEQVILEGFIPMTTIDDFPRARESVGLREYGLSFAADPVLGRHLARFLVRSLENVSSNETLSGLVDNLAAGKAVGFLKPTKVLFNGGVFHAPALRKRVLDLLTSWCRREVLELHGAARDLAVARGAAVYGRIRQKGERLRIRSGTTRSYYLGLETAMPAVPGFEPPVKGLCIVPQGLEEGSEICVEEQQFGLVTGDSVKFRFFSSSVRAGDRTGMVIEDAARELDDASSLALTLPSSGGTRDVVPVKLHAVVTEVGTLELWMQQVNADQKWKLEFNVRGEER